MRDALMLILAGGQGSRLDVLTVGRAKPSLPVGGTYRLIDLMLSNAANSGMADVWVVQQYEPHLLNEHLAGGRPWDLDRSRGGLRALPPFEGSSGEGFAEGNADALLRQARLIEAAGHDLVVVASADHLCAIDLATVVAQHRERGSDLTIVTTELTRTQDPTRHALVDVGRGQRVTGITYKPDDPPHRTAATEVFVYDREVLLGTLRELAGQGDPLGDYGESLVPAVVAAGNTHAVAHEGYWRDLGTPESYLDAQLELLRPRPPFRLDDPSWPIRTPALVRSPARIEGTAHVDGSWVSPGAVVRGTVVDSIIGPGAVVEKGAEVRRSVLFDDVRVAAGATVARAVLAEGVRVGARSRIGAPQARHPVLVGASRHLAAGTVLPAGTHLDPAHAIPPLRRAGRARA